LTGGEAADIKQAAALIEGLNTRTVVADKAYDADALLEHISARGAVAVIPPRPQRKEQRGYDLHWYKERNRVERFFSRIKQFRRIATRYEKLTRNYFSMLNLVCAYLWLA
jgi:transposase